MDPLAMFQVEISNMSTNRGDISKSIGGTNTNYGQCKNNVAQAIYDSNYNLDILVEQGIVPYNQTEYTRSLTTELLNTLKNDNGVVSVNDIHNAIGQYTYDNGYTIHEADARLTQIIPKDINGAFNHIGGVSDCRGNSKKDDDKMGTENVLENKYERRDRYGHI